MEKRQFTIYKNNVRMKKKEIIAAQKIKIEALSEALEACSKALEKSINDMLKLEPSNFIEPIEIAINKYMLENNRKPELVKISHIAMGRLEKYLGRPIDTVFGIKIKSSRHLFNEDICVGSFLD